MTTFSTRFHKYEPELRSIYMDLYHDEKAYEYFCSVLRRMSRSRRLTLRILDQQREQNPGWHRSQDMLGMQIYTQCFGGTLNGVREHLDYILESGANYLHLMPLLESPAEASDGGYAVSNFRKVQPGLGTMADLAALADECHEKGIAVCIDFVMNHTSDRHEWAMRAKAGDPEAQSRYFFYDNWDIPNRYEETVPQVFPTTAPGNFSWCPEANKVVMTTFYPFQWDLNYANPTVLNDMTENMLYLCNQGIDVVRLDAVPYIWKRLGTNCRNLPEVHRLVRLLNLAAAIVCPATLLLGEVVMEPDKVVPYFGTPDAPECHMLYNVTTMCTTWHTVATQDARLLRHQMDIVFALPRQYTFLNYLRCHDDIGWGLDYDFLRPFGIDETAHKRFLSDYFRGNGFGSEARGELYNDDPRLGDARQCGTTASLCGMESGSGESLQLDIALHAFLLTQSGLPILYSGDELGQLNDYSYHNDPLKAEDSRYLHRGNFDWKAAARKAKNPLYQALRRLETIRRTQRAFHADADVWTLEPWNNHILAIGRYYDGEKLIALFNFGHNREPAWLHEQETYTDLLSGERLTADSVTLEPCGFRWLVKDYPTKEG